MAKIARFEDIEAWEKARGIAKNVYAACRQGEFSRDFGLRDQIQRAAVSIMSNIAEGFERGTDKEFIQFFSSPKDQQEKSDHSSTLPSILDISHKTYSIRSILIYCPYRNSFPASFSI